MLPRRVGLMAIVTAGILLSVAAQSFAGAGTATPTVPMNSTNCNMYFWDFETGLGAWTSANTGPSTCQWATSNSRACCGSNSLWVAGSGGGGCTATQYANSMNTTVTSPTLILTTCGTTPYLTFC